MKWVWIATHWAESLDSDVFCHPGTKQVFEKWFVVPSLDVLLEMLTCSQEPCLVAAQGTLELLHVCLRVNREFALQIPEPVVDFGIHPLARNFDVRCRHGEATQISTIIFSLDHFTFHLYLFKVINMKEHVTQIKHMHQKGHNERYTMQLRLPVLVLWV